MVILNCIREFVSTTCGNRRNCNGIVLKSSQRERTSGAVVLEEFYPAFSAQQIKLHDGIGIVGFA